MNALEHFAGHKGENLSDGRSFEECIKWFTAGVLPGDTLTQAYSYYLTGQVYDEYFVDAYVEDFKMLRDHINTILEERSRQ